MEEEFEEFNENEKFRKIFWEANQNFLKVNQILFQRKVSERTLCGALMLALNDVIRKKGYEGYFVDVEYNRNVGSKFESLKKTCKGLQGEEITINCDLLVHSRGENLEADNLIALEMKKSNLSKEAKDRDRARLKALTSTQDKRLLDETIKKFPENVCGYKLGIYYEVNFKKHTILIEYYYTGQLTDVDKIDFNGNKL